jgi:hypothetical protein
MSSNLGADVSRWYKGDRVHLLQFRTIVQIPTKALVYWGSKVIAFNSRCDLVKTSKVENRLPDDMQRREGREEGHAKRTI